MERREVIKVLAEFFLDQFSEDASGVADWLEQQAQNVDEFYNEVNYIKNEK